MRMAPRTGGAQSLTCTRGRRASVGRRFWVISRHDQLQRAALPGNAGNRRFNALAIPRLQQFFGKSSAHTEYSDTISIVGQPRAAQPGVELRASHFLPEPLLRGAPDVCIAHKISPRGSLEHQTRIYESEWNSSRLIARAASVPAKGLSSALKRRTNEGTFPLLCHSDCDRFYLHQRSLG